MSNKGPLDQFYRDCLRIGNLKVMQGMRGSHMQGTVPCDAIPVLDPHRKSTLTTRAAPMSLTLCPDACSASRNLRCT